MASYKADLVDGGSAQTAGLGPVLETDYGNRGATTATPTLSQDQIDARQAVADANADALKVAKAIGGTVDANGEVVMPNNYQTGPASNTNQLKDKSNPPVAPNGYQYIWIGGTDTGSWKLYGSNPTPVAPAGPSATDASLAAQIAAQTAQAQATQAASQQNAITFLTQTFTDMGLGADIANAVTDLVKQGYTSDTIQLMAQDPKSTNPLAVAFQQRFPANAARMAAGLPVLSPAEYMATERSYAQVLNSYGLNSNFSTNKDVFTKLLTNDISPTELNSRASTAKQVIENTDPAVTQQLQAFYGLTQGDMIAHVLDPSIATPIIEKQISTAQIGAEASRYGANINQSYGEQLTALGITQAQAAQGFQSIAQQQTALQAAAATNPAYLQAGSVGSALQAATFGTTGSIQSQQELERLKTAMANPFGGSSGVSKGSLMGSEEGIS